MSVNLCYPVHEITLLTKKRFENILKNLPAGYTYEINVDHDGSILLDIKTEPETITTPISYFFGLIKKTHTEARQYTIAYIIFERRGSGWGRVSGTRLENAEALNFINKLSRNWISPQGEVKEITINITAPAPAYLASA